MTLHTKECRISEVSFRSIKLSIPAMGTFESGDSTDELIEPERILIIKQPSFISRFLYRYFFGEVHFCVND